MSSSMSDHLASMGIIKNPDNTFTRIPEFYPTTAACSDPSNPNPVLTKDIPINPQNETWARIYLPRRQSAAKLPLIIFIHGGGFLIGSPAITFFQKFCSDIVLHLPAVMVSVRYRLAPEHRLPAAYDDCFEALHWLKTTDDEWLTNHADFSNCFIMGNSAGGNAAFHVGLRAAVCVDQLMPLRIQGLILHQALFGGVERSTSEIRLANDGEIPLYKLDLGWDLVLPIAADRDHWYSNPMKEVKKMEVVVDKVRSEGWRVLVSGYEGDPLFDRQIELAKMLAEKGVVVVEDLKDGGSHGIEFYDDSYLPILCQVLKKFVLDIV